MKERVYRLLLAPVVLLLTIAPGPPCATPPCGGGGPPPQACSNQLKISSVTDINFGTIAVAGAGIVAVDTNDVRTTSGGVIALNSLVSAAHFDVTGCSDSAYAIVLPPSAILNSGASSMVMDGLITSPTSNGLLDATGYQELIVGANLNVLASQPAGAYTGTYVVEVIAQ